MKLISKPIIVLLFLIFTGCTANYNYVWKEYPITPDKISSEIKFTEGKEINIIKGKSDDSKISFGKAGWQEFFGNLQLITDGIADQLSKELQNQSVVINDTNKKTLEIIVNRSNFERSKGGWNNIVKIDFTVNFGNGKSKSYTVQNSSPGWVDRAYHGVIAVAVIEIINDPEVQAYINE